CGERREVIDHVIPWCTLRRGSTEYLVPACRSCNAFLNDLPLSELGERRGVIRDRLAKKYAKLLATPDWTKDELASIEGWLRVVVEGKQALKIVVRDRIDFLTRGKAARWLGVRERTGASG